MEGVFEGIEAFHWATTRTDTCKIGGGELGKIPQIIILKKLRKEKGLKHVT